jgi:predicted DNA-binding transcriptional regulator AlpA
MSRRSLPSPLSTGALLTRDQAAALIGVSPGTLRNWATQKRGPRFVRHGKNAMYPADEVAAWLQRSIEAQSIGWVG